MMFSPVIVASALVAVAYAQSTLTSVSIASTASQAMPAVATQDFDISMVNSTDKVNWCAAQRHTCTDMCLGHTQANQCIDETLAYTCVCYNGTEPDSTSFKQTIPFYECQATYGQCIAEHPNDDEAQGICIANEQCPTRDAAAESSASESGASSTSSGTASATGSQTTSASASGASSTSSQAAGTSVSPASTGAFVALLFAVCKLVL